MILDMHSKQLKEILEWFRLLGIKEYIYLRETDNAIDSHFDEMSDGDLVNSIWMAQCRITPEIVDKLVVMIHALPYRKRFSSCDPSIPASELDYKISNDEGQYEGQFGYNVIIRIHIELTYLYITIQERIS